MDLRPYQAAAVYSARAALASIAPGRRRSVLLVAPCGAGKTRIAGEAIRLAVARGKRCLFLAHRTEILDQTAETLTALGLHVGVISASSSREPDPSAPVQVASVQTLTARGDHPPADLIVQDECHWAPASTFRAVLDSYPQTTVLIGLTATPCRGDGTGLGGDLFSELVVVATHAELLTAGYLVPLDLIRPMRPLRPGQIAKRPADCWAEHARDRPTLVFAASVEHAQLVAGEFPPGIAAVVSADTPCEVRAEQIARFKTGGLRVLASVGVFTEGFDAPNASCAIIARGCGHAGLWIQMTGRISRPSPGKANGVVIDLRGVSFEFGHTYDPRTYSLTGRGIAPIKPATDQVWCRVCGAPIDPGSECAECGIGAKDRSITVTGDALVPYAAARAQGPDRRAANLKKWRAEQAQRQYKIGWAYVKYRAVYGESPSAEIIKLSHARE